MPDNTPGPLPLAWLVIAAISIGIGSQVHHETGSVSAGILGGLTAAGALYALLRRRRA